jgi:hypothetical protein
MAEKRQSVDDSELIEGSRADIETERSGIAGCYGEGTGNTGIHGYDTVI